MISVQRANEAIYYCSGLIQSHIYLILEEDLQDDEPQNSVIEGYIQWPIS